MKERILEAARTCFAAQGFDQTTTADICRAASISPATLYRHFRSKEALFAAVGRPELRQVGDNPYRREILAAALELFSQQGFDATSMTDIAGRAGVARATLYAQFPGKEAILEALFEETAPMALAQRMPAAGGEAFDVLQGIALSFLTLYQDPRRVALMRLTFAEGFKFPAVQTAFHHLVETGSGLLARYLAAVAPTLADPQFAARAFFGSLLSFVISQEIIPGATVRKYTSQEIARMLARQTLDGLRKEE